MQVHKSVFLHRIKKEKKKDQLPLIPCKDVLKLNIYESQFNSISDKKFAMKNLNFRLMSTQMEQTVMFQ